MGCGGPALHSLARRSGHLDTGTCACAASIRWGPAADPTPAASVMSHSPRYRRPRAEARGYRGVTSEQREHRPARHQPEDAEHGRERREAEREPDPEQPVIRGRQRGTAAYRVLGQIAHADLHEY